MSGWGGGWLGGCPSHMCTCTCMHMHTYACMVNMIISCKWPPPVGESLGKPYDVICACACVCMCAIGWNIEENIVWCNGNYSLFFYTFFVIKNLAGKKIY